MGCVCAGLLIRGPVYQPAELSLRGGARSKMISSLSLSPSLSPPPPLSRSPPPPTPSVSLSLCMSVSVSVSVSVYLSVCLNLFVCRCVCAFICTRASARAFKNACKRARVCAYKVNAPGIIGSMLGLVGPVSVYCDSTCSCGTLS